MDSRKTAKLYEDLLINIRRDLHRIPELGLNLPKTSNYVKSKLKEWDINFVEMIEGNAIVALIEGNFEGPCIAFRSDMDALPINEETGLSFSSTHNGCMHACGHDAHMAMALVTAKIISDNRKILKGSIKFIFQPGEEFPGGAKPMIEQGALLDPKPDFMIGYHVGEIIKFDNATIGLKQNEMMASIDKFTIEVHGKGGHGAVPSETIDPIIIASEIVLSLQKIISREISPTESGVVSVCSFSAGSTHNIIPSMAKISGTSRSLNETNRDYIEKRIKEISEGIAEVNGGKAIVNYERMYPVLKNNPDLTTKIKNLIERIFPDDVKELEKASMIGEDIAYFFNEIPGTFILLNNLKKNNEGESFSNHNAKFDIEESTLYKGVAINLEIVFGQNLI